LITAVRSIPDAVASVPRGRMIDEEILAKYGGTDWKTAVTFEEQAACKRLVKAGKLVELKQKRKGFASLFRAPPPTKTST